MSNRTYQQRDNQDARIPVSQRRIDGGRVLEDNRDAFNATASLSAVKKNNPLTNQQTQLAAMSHSNHPKSAKLNVVENINNTPYVTAQRQRIDNLIGGSVHQLTAEQHQNGIESLPELSMDNVKPHDDSAKSAQLRTSTYTQGADIHTGPGQEKHLPHEDWQLVQQMKSTKPALVSPNHISASPESNGTTVTQLMKYTSGINSTFKEQPTSMSCWAACIAAIKNIEISEVIGQYNHGWENTGLPPEQDMNVLVGDYGLMKYTPWQSAFTTFKHLGMVANNGHWIVVFGVETDDGEPEKVISLYTFDPETNQKQWYTIEEMNQWGASAAYA